MDRSRAEQSKNGVDHVITVSLTITKLTAFKSNGVTKFGNTAPILYLNHTSDR